VSALAARVEPVRDDAWRERVRAHVWRFDLASLLALLHSKGYRWDELRFSSHASTRSQGSLIENIEIDDEPRQVRITLNLGLLGAQSPLPSYFWKELDAGTVDATAFMHFVGFFDHLVIARHVLATHPELDAQLFPDEQRARGEEVQLLNLRSSATLHWLFAQVFPELDVRVEPITKQRLLGVGALCLGSAVLGEGTFGSRAPVTEPGRRVTLHSDDERAGSGRPWPIEVRARLAENVLPLLHHLGLALEVFLVIREQQSWARLTRGSHLGYDQLRGGAHTPLRIKLYDTSEERP
jgi:hypothetical protein